MFLGIFAAVWLLANRWLTRHACELLGHDADWPLGIACGYSGPLCSRCRTPL